MELRRLSALVPTEMAEKMRALTVSEAGIAIMLPKFRFYVFAINDIPGKAANILKQNMLSAGGEVALASSVAAFDPEPTTVYIAGTARHFQKLCPRLRQQPFGLKKVAQLIEDELALDEQP